MPLFDKLGDIARNVTDKAAEAVGAGKIAVDIKTQQLKINELLAKAGSYYYELHLKGVQLDPSVEVIFAQIDDLNDNIEALQAEKNAFKSSYSSGASGGALYCENCGARLQPGANFCDNCGMRLH